MKCPSCQRPLTFDWSIGTMRCEYCEFQLFQEEARQIRRQLDAIWDAARSKTRRASVAAAASPQATPAAAQSAATAVADVGAPITIDVPGGMDLSTLPEQINDLERVRMRGRLEAAMFALARNDSDGARLALRAALEISEDYVDAWLQLAALAEDRPGQRTYLEHALAADPTNPIARKAILMLDGELDPVAPPGGPLAPGQATGQQLTCPQCGGALTYDEAQKRVTCAFCGYQVLDANEMTRGDHHSTVLEATLKRKYAGKTWNIGHQWLRCTACGAIATISQRTLTTTCRFCHSRHVIQESVNSQFEQPDLIVPFTVDIQAAHTAIEEKMRSGIRAITRFFSDAIARIDLYGGYLPFWIFDADMVVNWSWTNAPAHGKHPVLLSDVPYLATPSPPRQLLDKVEPYDLLHGVDYDPRLLAIYPAQLYTLDIVQASIDVRTKLGRLAMRQAETGLRVRRPSNGYGGDDDPGSLRMNAYTAFLTYRLALLPVWIGLLVEEDGDIRQVLVNGQTGKVAVGKVTKAG